MQSAALQEAPGFMPWSERLDARDAPAGKAIAWLQEPGLLTERLRACCGERLASIPGIVRGPLEFARLGTPSALYQRALRRHADPPPSLWARRSWFAIDGARLMVQEVFLPEVLA